MDIISDSYTKTKDIGRTIGAYISKNNVIGLFGGLASGKTVITKGILQGLGMKDTRFVNSPTFLIMKQYRVKDISIYHFDFYRIKDINEVYNIGWDDFLNSDSVCIIEWAQNIEEIMPDDYLKINLSIKNKSSRRFQIVSEGKKYKKVVKSISLHYS